jgi:hypothetical protein
MHSSVRTDLQPEARDELRRYGTPGAWHRHGGRHSYNHRWSWRMRGARELHRPFRYEPIHRS